MSAGRGDPHQVLTRAFSRLGEGGYNLTQNNCQHFARWCKTDDARSDEVDRVLAVTKGTAVNRIASKIALLAPAAAAAEGLSGGASLMSGLSTIGGTAVGGVALVAGVPAALAAAATCEVLKDDPHLPADEREARRLGRRAAVSGAAGGVGLSIALMHTAGIPGLSAVGITSALKTLGLGTMLRGLAVVGGLPAVAALACGMLVYSRKRKRLSGD